MGGHDLSIALDLGLLEQERLCMRAADSDSRTAAALLDGERRAMFIAELETKLTQAEGQLSIFEAHWKQA